MKYDFKIKINKSIYKSISIKIGIIFLLILGTINNLIDIRNELTNESNIVFLESNEIQYSKNQFIINNSLEEKIVSINSWVMNKSIISDTKLNETGIVPFYQNDSKENIHPSFVRLNWEKKNETDNLILYNNSNIFGMNFILIQNQTIKCIYQNIEYYFSLGDEFLPYYENWFFRYIDKNSVEIAYSGWNILISFIETMVWLYRATNDDGYLNQTFPIIEKIISDQDEFGLYYLQYSHQQEKKYSGMVQSLYIHALLEYYLASNDPTTYQALLKALNGYYHTTEGTTNHRVNSLIGSCLKKIFLENSLDFRFELSNLEQILSLIEEDGKISLVFPDNNDFPKYIESYWAYDARVLMTLSKYIFTNKIFTSVFPTLINNTIDIFINNDDLEDNLMTLFYAYSMGLIDDLNSFYPLMKNLEDIQIHNTFDALTKLRYYAIKYCLFQNKPFFLTYHNTNNFKISKFGDTTYIYEWRMKIAAMNYKDLAILIKFPNKNYVYEIQDSKKEVFISLQTNIPVKNYTLCIIDNRNDQIVNSRSILYLSKPKDLLIIPDYHLHLILLNFLILIILFAVYFVNSRKLN